MDLQLSTEQKDLVDNQEEIKNLVISDILSATSSGLRSARSERPYSFIRDSLESSQEKNSMDTSAQSIDNTTRAANNVLKRECRPSASGNDQKVLVSPEEVAIPNFRGEIYYLPNGEIERKQFLTAVPNPEVVGGNLMSNEQKNPSDIRTRFILSGSDVVDSLLPSDQKLPESTLDVRQVGYLDRSLRTATNLQERLAELQQKYPQAAQLAQEARDSERILEFLTNATTDEPSFMAEFSALQEVQELWRTTRPELYRLVLKYSTVREQIGLLMRADRDKGYQDVLMNDLVDAKKRLTDLRSVHPDIFELINSISLVQSQIASINGAISHKGHLNDKLTCLRAKLHQLQTDNQALFAQQTELQQLEKRLKDLQEFSKDYDKFSSYKSSILSAYRSLQLECPELVASFLELKQLKHELDTIKAVKEGLIDIQGDIHEAQRQLKQLTESNLELASFLREKKSIEEDIAELQNGMQNITQIADIVRSLQAVYVGIKAENPELVELLERRKTLKDRVVQLRSFIANQRYLEEEVTDLQRSFDDLSRKHHDVLLLLDRRKEIQANLESLKLYATNISILERDIDAKTRTYIELCKIFPDIKEKLLKRKCIEEDIALFKRFSKDPARLARDNLALSNAYEQCRAMSPVITSMLNTRTSLADLVSESAQCNELGIRSLQELHSDELHASISSPPPEPLPPEIGGKHERRCSLSNPTVSQREGTSLGSSQQPRSLEYEQEFTEAVIADRILNVDLPNMMNSFFGISTPHVKRGRQMRSTNSPLRRTIS